MSAPSQTSSTRERQRRQSRERILRAAVNSFARAGFEAASLSRIAADAGVKKALVQYHFTTKDTLWREAATRLWAERNARLKQFVAGRGPTERGPTERGPTERGPATLARNMRPAFTALVEFTREQPEWLWFMFHEAQVDGPRRQWLIEHCLRDDYVLGQDFVRQCQEQGLIRQAPPLHLLHLITGALTYNLLVAPQTQEATGTDLASPEAIARQVDLLLEMLAP